MEEGNKSTFSGLIKQCDIYAQPVYFTFKNDQKFKTVFGGISAILTVLIILGYGIAAVVTMWQGEYTQSVIIDYNDILNLYNPYVMSVDNFTLAVSINSYNSTLNPNYQSYLLPVYAQISPDPSNPQGFNIETVIEATECNIAHLDESNSENPYYCPSVGSIEVAGQDLTFNATEFIMMIGTCSFVQTLLNSSTSNCSTEDVLYSQFYVNYAFVSNQFNFQEGKQTADSLTSESISFYRQPLNNQEVQLITYEVAQSNTSYTAGVFDFIGFLSRNYFFEYYNTRYNSQIQYDLELAEEYSFELGIFNVKLIQSPTQGLTTITQSNIIDAISGIGGFVTAVTYTFIIILASHQDFWYESSLIKSLYWERKKTQSRRDTIQEEPEARETGYSLNAELLLESRESVAQNRRQERETKKGEIKQELEAQQPFSFRSSEWWRYYCRCCLKQERKTQVVKRKDKFDLVKKTLNEELDIAKIIQHGRVLKFALKLILKKYHRSFVKHFQKFNTDHLACIFEKDEPTQDPLEKLDFRLEPDQRIYNELIVKRCVKCSNTKEQFNTLYERQTERESKFQMRKTYMNRMKSRKSRMTKKSLREKRMTEMRQKGFNEKQIQEVIKYSINDDYSDYDSEYGEEEGKEFQS